MNNMMWYLRTWFNSGLGSVRFVVGLNDRKGLFQPKWFYDSISVLLLYAYSYLLLLLNNIELQGAGKLLDVVTLICTSAAKFDTAVH